MHCLLLLLACCFHCRQMLLLTRRSWPHRTPTRTEHHLRALRTRLRRERPIHRPQPLMSVLPAKRARLRHMIRSRALRRRDVYRSRVFTSTALDAIPRRQKGVEALDELRITREEIADPANNTRRIYRTGLEVLHDVEEFVVDVWVIRELDFHLVEITQCVVQNRLLPLTLTHLLLCDLRLSSRREWHEQAGLHLLSRLRLSGLNWTTSEDIARSNWRTKRQLRRWLRALDRWVSKQTIRTVNSPRSHGYRLVKHGRALLVWRGLFQSLTL